MDKTLEFNLLLNSDLQHFIKEHECDDEKELVLKHREIMGIPSADVAQQIAGRRKAKLKLPFLYNTTEIIYPPSLNLEQCSSELTARFKASIFSGSKAIDLTGGFGVDSYFLSKRFDKFIHVEKNKDLLQIAKQNHGALGATNVDFLCVDADSFIKSVTESYDLIYIDPSRRSLSNKKVFKFAECSPDVASLLPTLLEKSKIVLIKASPLIDITQGLRELGNVSKVFVVGFNNECKEVLFLVSQEPAETIIQVSDLSPEGIHKESFSFTFTEESKAEISFSEPLRYLYEPNAMVLKAGAFKLVAKRNWLRKIAPNTHLYTSEDLVNTFPGRIFKIEKFFKSNSKSAREHVPHGYANITTRNYPLTSDQLKKKLKLKDGGDQFVIGFSGRNKKYLALAGKVK